MLIVGLITTFHHVVSEESGNDVTIGRAKTMIALAALTWAELNISVAPRFINSRRIMWTSEELDSVSIGGAFRRDPIGDDAQIILDDDEPRELVQVDRMRECASFIPLFGRQRLERFNVTLAGAYLLRNENRPLPLPGSEPAESFPCDDEYRRLFDWFVKHGAIGSDGSWQHAGDVPKA